jgi:hypothetical protein
MDNTRARLQVHQLRAGLRRHVGARRLDTVRRIPVGRQDGDDHVRPLRRRDRRTGRGRTANGLARKRKQAGRRWASCRWWPARSSFYLFQDTYDEATRRVIATLRPHSPWLEDYHILQTTKDEYILGAIRRGLEAAGVPVEFSKGEAGRGQHEMNLDYTTAGRDGRPQQRVQDRGEGDRASERSLGRASWPSTTSTTRVRRAMCTAACGRSTARKAEFDDHHGPHGMSETFQHYVAGLIATAQEFSLLWAPTGEQLQALPTRVMGADRDRLGRRQSARSASARSGTARALGRVPHSGQRQPTATSRSPVRSPAGSTGSATSSHLARRTKATATRHRHRPDSVEPSPTRSHCGRARRSRRSASETMCTTTS